MEPWDSNTIAAASAAQQVLRDYVVFHGKDENGDPMDIGFWTGEDDVTVTVVSAVDGEPVSYDYVGGALNEIDTIVTTIGLDARPITLRLSHLKSAAQDAVRAYSIRHAVVEIHRGRLGADTFTLVADPLPLYLGKVLKVDVDTPEEGGEGAISVTCVPSSIGLTRTNPAKKSDEQQKRRSGDRFRRYSDTASPASVWWGEARAD